MHFHRYLDSSDNPPQWYSQDYVNPALFLSNIHARRCTTSNENPADPIILAAHLLRVTKRIFAGITNVLAVTPCFILKHNHSFQNK